MASFPYPYRDDSWKIWFKRYVDGKYIGSGVWLGEYKHKSSAVRRAKKQYDEPRVDWNGHVTTFEWVVSQTNPWKKGE